MYTGFDYGTSHCAIAAPVNQQIQLVNLESDTPYMPSNLHIAHQGLLVQAMAQTIADDQKKDYIQRRRADLLLASRIQDNLSIDTSQTYWNVGQQAIKTYRTQPLEGWFVKSPKSFLGAAGMGSKHIYFLQDIVALMMAYAKTQAEAQLNDSIDQVVIGRPINFQGPDSQKSNEQAINILTEAARLVGFKQVEFFYEPLGAGIDFETSLTRDQTVLVIDAGGGTTDCSLIRMGPSHIHQQDRNADFLGHSGMRVGGNDFDIQLTYTEIMKLLGKNTTLKSGLPVPHHLFYIASQVNDIPAQAEFYSQASEEKIMNLQENAQQPELIRRLATLQQEALTFALWQSAEECKINLCQQDSSQIGFDYLETGLSTNISQATFNDAAAHSIRKISDLILEPARQAATTPDLIYLTGGTAKLPIVQAAVKQQFPQTPMVDGNYFGSVATGLAKWAQRLFR